MPLGAAAGGAAAGAGGLSTGTALLGAGALSAGGSIFSGLTQANASKQAAQIASQTDLQIMQQIEGMAQPVIAQGSGIVNQIQPMLTALLTGGPGSTAALQSPALQAVVGYGQQSALQSAAKMGLGTNAAQAGAQMAGNVLLTQGFQPLLQGLLGNEQIGAGLQTGALGPLTSAMSGLGGSAANALGAGTMGAGNAIAGIGSSLGSLPLSMLTTSALLNKLGGTGGMNTGNTGGGALNSYQESPVPAGSTGWQTYG